VPETQDPADYKLEAKKDTLMVRQNVRRMIPGRNRGLGTLVMTVGEFIGVFTDVSISPSGAVLVINTNGDNIERIQRYTGTGVLIDETTAEEIGNQTLFGIAADAQGYIYVTDDTAGKVRKFASDVQFVSEWGGTGAGEGQFDTPTGIAVDASGGYVYVADTWNNRVENSGDLFMLKTDSSGNEALAQTYIFSEPGQVEIANSVAETSDGVFVAAGYTADSEGVSRVLVVKVDGDGSEVWNKVYGGTDYYVGLSVIYSNLAGFSSI